MEDCIQTKRILNYCREALEEMRTETPTGALWERRWLALLASLRTACELLEREAPIYWTTYMKQPNAHIQRRDAKKGWKPDIFGKFIWTDANLFLHEGISTAGQSVMLVLQGVAAKALAAGEKYEPLPAPPPPRAPIISYHMNTPPYLGQDPRDVAEQAIAWLNQQIAIAET